MLDKDDKQKKALDACLRGLRAFAAQLEQEPGIAEVSTEELVFALGAAMANHIVGLGQDQIHQRLNLFLEAFSSYAHFVSENENNRLQAAFSFLTMKTHLN